MRAYSFFELGSIEYVLQLCRSTLRFDLDNDMDAKMYKILRQIKEEKKEGDDEFKSEKSRNNILCKERKKNNSLKHTNLIYS